MGRVPYTCALVRADDRRPKAGFVSPSHRRRFRPVWAPCVRPARPVGARYARPWRAAHAPATAAAARCSAGGSIPPAERPAGISRPDLWITLESSIVGAGSALGPALRPSWTRRTIYCIAAVQSPYPRCVLPPRMPGTRYNRV